MNTSLKILALVATLCLQAEVSLAEANVRDIVQIKADLYRFLHIEPGMEFIIEKRRDLMISLGGRSDIDRGNRF